MSTDRDLSRLLEHPAIWRGRSAAQVGGLPTGFAALDACLPGRGWPRTGLIEILLPRCGIGESYLLLPALAALTRLPAARWCVWIAPFDLSDESGLPSAGPSPLAAPGTSALHHCAAHGQDLCALEPFAPALAAHGLVLDRVLVVRPPGTMPTAALWAFEQSLGSGACEVAMAWLRQPRAREIRRWQLAALRGRALGILFRPHSAAREPSPAALRLILEPATQGVRVTLLKSRGGARGWIELAWQEAQG
jgi:protein ImuA